ncbi:MAG: KaiC 1 [Elusimicrobia bacterium RIFOXYB2_FULL_49_7]|nr:MAG: KaiC 1 [Elusimicrobia bacterium RIFOXYB2_FULL_49_7]
MATPQAADDTLRKCLTGIHGFDAITNGGLPKGRTALVCGGAGCGKTVFAAEFIVRGATEHNEPGVFMSFEENTEELTKNFASMGFDLSALIAKKKVFLDYVYIERSEIEETGDYNLEGLFVRLGHAIDSIGAKRVVLDTIEALFSGLNNTTILRAELRRLFRWLKDKGVTVVITGEKGEGTLTRYGIEEYVADCVVMLDHRIIDQISTRRMRIVKYRGSAHGTNEYPFLITSGGISIFPITSVGLNYTVSDKRVSSGIPALDKVLGGKGYYHGSSVLVSGTAGTGKSSIALTFAESVCRQGKKCLFFAMEESVSQIVRNMHSIGVNIEPHLKKKLLTIHASRPTLTGLEMYLVTMHELVKEHKPDVVIVDPVSNLIAAGITSDVKLMLTRTLDFLKSKNITCLFTDLSQSSGNKDDRAEIGISSLMDTCTLLANLEMNGEHVRTIRVIKSRGMANSSLSYRFLLSGNGVDIVDVLKNKDNCFVRKAQREYIR